MVTIPQHADDGTLNDMPKFLLDIERHCEVQAWRVRIEWCLGDGADGIEKRSAGGIELVDSEFRQWYRGIYQTVDGWFATMRDGDVKCELFAVDSSYWEITGTPGFEMYMLKKYGSYTVAK